MVHCHTHIVKNVKCMTRNLAGQKGTILVGTDKLESLHFLAVVLGRHLSTVHLHQHSNPDKLNLILAGLKNPLDLVAFKMPTLSQTSESSVFFKEISDISFKTEAFLPGTGQATSSRIFFLLEDEDPAFGEVERLFTLGSRFQLVQAARANDQAVIGWILQGFGMSPSLRMIQSMFVISKLKSNSFSETALSTSREWTTTSKKLFKKANLMQEIRDTFFGGDLAVRKLFSVSNPFLRAVGQECFNDIVSEVFQQPTDQRCFDPRLKAACDRRHLRVSKTLKRQLEALQYARGGIQG